MNKIKITKDMLEGFGSKILATGITTDKVLNYYNWGDENKPLKFVVCKGDINDWCIYIECMDRDMSYSEVKDEGDKIHDIDRIKFLIDCSDEVLERYRQ